MTAEHLTKLHGQTLPRDAQGGLGIDWAFGELPTFGSLNLEVGTW
jgi:hypothetical protein